jgi:catechol 2,3-dioxygenase-like lactoylglutathione lyase family enzyme
MKLNHINLPVEDVATTSRFFEQYFDFTCTETKGDNVLAVLKGEDDFTLVLMSKAFNRNAEISYPEAFHIGFLVNSNEQVDKIYQRLIAGGVTLDKSPGQIRGQYGFYFMAPGDLLTEVMAY